MCLNLIGSKFNNIKEVEQLLDCEYITEQEIIEIKDNREQIEYYLDMAGQFEELDELGL